MPSPSVCESKYSPIGLTEALVRTVAALLGPLDVDASCWPNRNPLVTVNEPTSSRRAIRFGSIPQSFLAMSERLLPQRIYINADLRCALRKAALPPVRYVC